MVGGKSFLFIPILFISMVSFGEQPPPELPPELRKQIEADLRRIDKERAEQAAHDKAKPEASAQKQREIEAPLDQRELHKKLVARLQTVKAKLEGCVKDIKDEKNFYFPKGVSPDFAKSIPAILKKVSKTLDNMVELGPDKFDFMRDTLGQRLLIHLDTEELLVDYVRAQGKIQRDMMDKKTAGTLDQGDVEKARVQALRELHEARKKTPVKFDIVPAGEDKWKNTWTGNVFSPPGWINDVLRMRDSAGDASLIPKEWMEEFDSAPAEDRAFIVQAVILMKASNGLSAE